MITNPNPPNALKSRWGPLAYVSEEERAKILALPAGQAKATIKRLENKITAIKKKQKGKYNAAYNH